MANENPLPFDNTSPATDATVAPGIEVLLAGNIADDDMMWVVRCPVTELFRLVQTPVEWVAALADLPGWKDATSGKPAPRPVLTRDFALSVQTTSVTDPLGRVVVQGISGTNALSVVANPGSFVPAVQAFAKAGAAAAVNPFQAFWDAVAKDPTHLPSGKKRLPVNVALPIGRFFAHFEILDPTETPAERAVRTGTFLLAAALDPTGYAAMLGGLDQTTTLVDGSGARPGKALRFASIASPSLTYANVEPTGTTDDDGETTICGTLAGTYTDDSTQGPKGTPDTTLVKRYGGDEPPTDPTIPNS